MPSDATTIAARAAWTSRLFDMGFQLSWRAPLRSQPRGDPDSRDPLSATRVTCPSPCCDATEPGARWPATGGRCDHNDRTGRQLRNSSGSVTLVGERHDCDVMSFAPGSERISSPSDAIVGESFVSSVHTFVDCARGPGIAELRADMEADVHSHGRGVADRGREVQGPEQRFHRHPEAPRPAPRRGIGALTSARARLEEPGSARGQITNPGRMTSGLLPTGGLP